MADTTVDLNPGGGTGEQTTFLSAADNNTDNQSHTGSRLSLNFKKLKLNIGDRDKKKEVRINDETEKYDADSQGSYEEEDEERGAWGGKMEFIFTCIGYAVGLGNVWRFPYLAYKNGGGAFLVPYIFMLSLVGLPLFFKELAFGQYASLGPISIWKINKLFKGLGYAMVMTSWLIAVYYNVVISHVMCFLFASFASIPTQLPWISCDNEWNTPDCIEPNYAKPTNATNATLEGIANFTDAASTVASVAMNHYNHTMNGTGKPQTPAEEYYKLSQRACWWTDPGY